MRWYSYRTLHTGTGRKQSRSQTRRCIVLYTPTARPIAWIADDTHHYCHAKIRGQAPAELAVDSDDRVRIQRALSM